MRSRLNLALVVAAGALALVLTVIRQSPEGIVSLELNTTEARAMPGEPMLPRHDLSALKIFNMTLVRIKDRYVDPGRVDPRKMLYAALDGVQLNIPEVLVEPDVELKIFNMTLVRIKDRYVDPGRVDPRKMLYAALDGVQLNIPEVLVEPDVAH